MNCIRRKNALIILCVLTIGAYLLTSCEGPDLSAINEITAQSLASASEQSKDAVTDTTSTDNIEPYLPNGQSNIIDVVDENINAVSLTEDEALTAEALANNIVENISIILPKEIPDALDTGLAGGDSINVIRGFDTRIPDSMVENLKYSQYKVANDYLLITSSSVNVRALPDPEAAIVGKAKYYEKVTVLAEVQGIFVESEKTDLWYRVVIGTGEQTLHGYILSSLAQLRTFQFPKMSEAITLLKNDADNHLTAYISNYKNINGQPPYYSGSGVDAYGVERYQSAPAYFEANTESGFRYIEDGTLVSILEERENFYKINTLNFAGDFYVPKRYVSLSNSIDQLTKVIVVDRNNQNEGVFEYIDNQWNLISYIYATTGESAQFKQPTSLGYFMAIQKVDKFLYLDDVTRQLAGYAPYGIRFGGGAYIHGVPIDKIGMEYPPMREYLFTIGTVPRSHKCVRNYTSHAKFLLDWSEIGKTAVIVIE